MFWTPLVWQLWCLLSATLSCLEAYWLDCRGSTDLPRWSTIRLDAQRKEVEIHVCVNVLKFISQKKNNMPVWDILHSQRKHNLYCMTLCGVQKNLNLHFFHLFCLLSNSDLGSSGYAGCLALIHAASIRGSVMEQVLQWLGETQGLLRNTNIFLFLSSYMGFHH